MPKPKPCKDCATRDPDLPNKPQSKWRPAPHPGPRCATDHRAWKQTQRRRNRANNLAKRFGLTLEEKAKLKEFQNGMCICGPWTGYNGSGKRDLSVDHDHKTEIIRGLLCKHCNDLLGRVRDDPAYFIAMLAYLDEPPAVLLFGERKARMTRVGKEWVYHTGVESGDQAIVDDGPVSLG